MHTETLINQRNSSSSFSILFSKSIYDNIRVSKMNSRLDEVKEASKAADAHDFIRKLPMQYYTFLVEAGEGLSGGEKHGYVL